MESKEKELLEELKSKRMIIGGDYSTAICRNLEQKGWIKVTWNIQDKPIAIAQSPNFRLKYKQMFGE
jgi:hypothetical protein